MVIFIHVLIALASIVQTTSLLFSPSYTKLKGVYGLFFATVASGSYVLITMPSHLMQTCVEGLVYMGFVGGVILVTRNRISKTAH
jgi:hypothetical protein